MYVLHHGKFYVHLLGLDLLIVSIFLAGNSGGFQVTWLVALESGFNGLGRRGFKPWPGTLCFVLGEET